MKKKFFSKLLMGALLVATVSSYVSCKDYDDDIANLQSQIDKKATLEQIAALQSDLASTKSTAESALAQAQANLQALAGKADQSALDATNAAVASVRTAAEEAGTKAGQAITDAAAAKAAADEAKADAAQAAIDAQAYTDEKIAEASAAAQAAIETALAGYATQEDLAAVKNDLAKLGDTYATIATTDKLREDLTALQNEVKDLIAVSDNEETLKLLKECQDKVDAYAAGIEALWSAVTSVSLYVTGGAINNKDVQNGTGHGLWPINFFSTTEVDDSKFPKNEKDADNQYTFTEGKKSVIKDNYILIRVSPVTANVEKEMIKLINSQGAEIPEELLKVTKVERYGSLLTASGVNTRADNNGLWKVSVEVQDDYKQATYDEAAGLNKKAVLYAVAVNNTKDIEAGAERAVISEYDLYLHQSEIGEYDETFTVNGIPVKDLHNRYLYTEDHTSTSDREEYIWKENSDGTDYVRKSTNWTKNDVVGRVGKNPDPNTDNRQEYPFVNAEVGQDIEITFLDKYYENSANIKGFYVTLDYDFAKESEPSELNAWNSYEYVGVGKVDKNGNVIEAAHLFDGNTGTIKVLSQEADGDYIGFRVYAVNWDGTLCDPDGRAFYVHLGQFKERTMGTLTVTVEEAKDTPSQAFEIDGADIFPDEADNWTWTWADKYDLLNSDYDDWAKTVKNADQVTGEDWKIDKCADATNGLFEFQYSNKNNGGWQSTPNAVTVDGKASPANVKYVRVTLTKKAIQAMKDNQVYTLILTARKNVTDGNTGTTTVRDLATITVNVQKLLPEGLPAGFSLKANMSVEPLKVYVRPDEWDAWTGTSQDDWKGAPKAKNQAGYAYDLKPFDLTDIYNGLKNYDDNGKYDEDYAFIFSNSDYDASAKKDRYTVATYGKQNLLVEAWDSKPGTQSTGLITTSYSVPFVNAVKLGGPNPVAVNYTYGKKNGGISVTAKSNGEPADNVPLPVTRSKSEVFHVQYIDALDLSRIKQVGSGQYNSFAIYGKEEAQTTANNANYQNMLKAFEASKTVEYDKSDPNSKRIEFSNVTYWDKPNFTDAERGTLGMTDAKYTTDADIPSTWLAGSSAATANNTGLQTLLNNGYVKIVGTPTADKTFVKENFTISYDDNGLIFTKKSSQSDPAWDGNPIESEISIPIMDCLGTTYTVKLTLKFVVKLQDPTARGL